MKKNKKVIFTIILLIAFQCSMYIVAKLTPLDYHIVNISFDQKIPFIKYFVYSYILWYVGLFLVPYLYSKNEEKFYKIYIKSVFLAIIIAFICYVLYPTTLTRSSVEVTDLSTYLVNLIYELDTPAINCFPSMHCLTSFLHIFITPQVKGIKKSVKTIIIIHATLVILSTLFIKQHVIVDVIGSFVLGIMTYTLSYIFYVRKNLSSAKS